MKRKEKNIRKNLSAEEVSKEREERKARRAEAKKRGGGKKDDKKGAVKPNRGTRRAVMAESPERSVTKSDCLPGTGEYVGKDQMGSYRSASTQIYNKFDDFIRQHAALSFMEKVVMVKNNQQDQFEIVAINSDNDFCDRKKGYLDTPGSFAQTRICCASATRRENISVIFAGNVLGESKAKRNITRKTYLRSGEGIGDHEVFVTGDDGISSEVHVPEYINKICNAVEETTATMPKKGKKTKEVEVGDDGTSIIREKDVDPRDQTLVLNVGIFSVIAGSEDGKKPVRMCAITCNGIYSQETAMRVMTELKEKINKVEGCEQMGVFIVPMEETPRMISKGTRYVHCETLFSNMIRDVASNSSRELQGQEGGVPTPVSVNGRSVLGNGIEVELLDTKIGATVPLKDIGNRIGSKGDISNGFKSEDDDTIKSLMPPRIKRKALTLVVKPSNYQGTKKAGKGVDEKPEEDDAPIPPGKDL